MSARYIHPVEAAHLVRLLLEKSWSLQFKCQACDRKSEVPPNQLAERFGVNVTVGQIAERAVCAGCGSHDLIIYETQYYGPDYTGGRPFK